MTYFSFGVAHNLFLFSEFNELVNTSSDALTFTMNAQLDQINFLDVNVILTENGLKTNLYRKPADRNMFLHGSS